MAVIPNLFEEEKNSLVVPDLFGEPKQDLVIPDLFDKRIPEDEDDRIGLKEEWIRKPPAIPLDPFPAIETYQLFKSTKRLQSKDYVYVDENQRKFDEYRVSEYIKDISEEQRRGKTIPAKVYDIVSDMPSYMLEFLLTGGLATFGKKAVVKGLTKTLGKVAKKRVAGLAIKGVGWGVSGGLRAAQLPHKVAESVIGRRIPEGMQLTEEGKFITEGVKESPFTSAWKGFGDVWIEMMSEEAGAGLTKGLSIISKKVPFISKAVRKLGGKWIGLGAGRNMSKFYSKIGTATGYHGVLEEMGEERLGDFMRAVVGIQDFGAGEGADIFDRVIASIPKPEQMLIEGIAFSIPGVARAGAGMLMQKTTPKAPIEPTITTPAVEPTQQVAPTVKPTPQVKPTGIAKGKVLYRGGLKSGSSFSSSKSIANDFAKNRGGKVSEFVLDANAKVAKYDDVPNVKYKDITDDMLDVRKDKRQFMDVELEREFKKATTWAKENGYDAIQLPAEGEIRVINPKVITPTTPKPTPTSISQEAIKAKAEGKSVEELKTVDDVKKAIKIGTEKYGSKNAYLASDEYKAIYPKVEEIYKPVQREYAEKADTEFKKLGLNLGDKVERFAPQLFGGVDVFRGTVAKRGSNYIVRLNSPQMTSEGIRKEVPINANWKLAKPKTIAEKPISVKRKILSMKDIEILKQKPVLSKFAKRDDKYLTTKQGEYTNGSWLLKSQFVPDKLKTRMKADLMDTHPDSKSAWDKVGKNPELLGDIDGYYTMEDIDITAYVFKLKSGGNVIVQKPFYDYLQKHIPEFNLKASKPDNALGVFSGNKEAGLLMPIKSGITKEKIKWIKTKAQLTDIYNKAGVEKAVKVEKVVVKPVIKKPTVMEAIRKTKGIEDVDKDVAVAYEQQKELWFQDKDVRVFKTKTEKSRLQTELRTALSEKKYTENVKNYDKAIQLYIDTQRNPEHLAQYYNKLSPEQKKIADIAQDLPANVKQIADKISNSYKEIGLEAQEADV